jgi:hypothetical protein
MNHGFFLGQRSVLNLIEDCRGIIPNERRNSGEEQDKHVLINASR